MLKKIQIALLLDFSLLSVAFPGTISVCCRKLWVVLYHWPMHLYNP